MYNELEHKKRCSLLVISKFKYKKPGVFMKRVFLVLIICTFMLSMFPYNNSGIGVFDNIVFAEETITNKLQNGSFEQGQTFTSAYSQPDQSAVPYWNTTAFQGKIELLRENTGTYIKGVTLKPKDGTYAAELNAD